jgi:hypothetical protein
LRELNLSGGGVRIPDFSFDFHCGSSDTEELRYYAYIQQWWDEYKHLNNFQQCDHY